MLKLISTTFIVTLALVGAGVAAVGNSASVPLSGVVLKHKSVTTLKSTGQIKASGKYLYAITGEFLGQGDLKALVPAPKSIEQFLNGLKPGLGKTLKGSIINEGGQLPFSGFIKTIKGTKTIKGLGTVSFTFTLKASIDANGFIVFTLDKVSFKDSSGAVIKGSLQIRAAKLLVQVAPTFEAPVANIGVFENASSITLNVRRFGALDAVASVAYATEDVVAVAGMDYLPVSGTLTFAKGESVKSVTIELIDNFDNDTSRAFKFVISSPSANAQLGTKTATTVTIRDNE